MLFNHGHIATRAIFPPNTIFGSDLIAWYKADAGLTLSGSLVDQWDDQSGNSAHLIERGAAAQQPTYSAAGGPNSNPMVQFDPTGGASGNFLRSDDNTLNFGNQNNHSAFCVSRVRANGVSPSSSFMLGYLGNGQSALWNNTASVLWNYLISGTKDMRNIKNSTNYNLTTLAALNTWYRIGVVCDGTNFTTYVDNTQTDQDAAAVTLNTGRLEVGSQFSSVDATRFIGDFTEIVIVKAAATAQQRSDLDAYFRNKWGI